MSKYDPLWHYVAARNADALLLHFDEAAAILGFPIDHALLTCKKELSAYGYQIKKISMKAQTVAFERIEPRG